jgi:nucleotide-binding universal stress UspA family protein
MSTFGRYPILIAIDDSEYAEIVLEHALDQAARHDAPDLHVLRVIDTSEPDLEHERRWLHRAVVEALDGVGGGREDWRTRIHVRCGRPAAEIVNLAAEIDARLLVIGRFGMHGRRSVADRVVETAPCPTLVVGRVGREVDSEPQCPACVAARAESEGERWFCAEHASPGRLRLSTLVPPITAARGSFY